MHRRLLALAITNVLCAICAPTDHTYDYTKFDEVHDQRQNGTENYKVDVNGVLVVWTAPDSLLSAVTLLDPGLLGGDYSDLEEILHPQKPSKPDSAPEVIPEKPSSSTTTSLPPAPGLVPENNEVPGGQNGTARHDVIVKRKYKIPIFIRPFLERRKD